MFEQIETYSIQWVKTFLGKNQEILGRIAQGNEVGKIVFIEDLWESKNIKPNEFLKVEITANFKKALHARVVEFETEPYKFGEGYMSTLLEEACSFKGPLSEAKKSFDKKLESLRSAKKAKEEES